MWIRKLVLAAGIPLLASAQHVIDLSGKNWTVKNAHGNVSASASLPSEVHLDLYAAGVIPDPYAGTNEIDLRWIAWSNWTYTSSPVKGLLDNASSSWLVFNGLDTFATIELCGKVVGTANNQFRQWQYDVSHVLKSCKSDPVISINFGSAPAIANAIANETGQETWPSGVQGLFEFDNRWFIRKEQSDFGWDWGPAFSPTGPWQPAYLVQFAPKDGVYVLNTDIDIHREGQVNWLPPDQTKPWVVNASIDYLGSLPKGASLTVEIKDSQNSTTIASGSLTNVTTNGNSISGITTVGANVPNLWWPTGMGDQNLYFITVNVVDSNGKTILASVTKRSGFRTIILNQTNITDAQLALGIAPGANWHFEINGHEFYAKGSNFIPPDAFWPRVTEDRMNTLFDSIVSGNQNMLRVWASGAYLPDFIYDIADERGVLLWSEFEFSDALYPVDQDFLDNVAAEVTYNVRRLNHHPSLALWAGGNELESLELLLVYYNDPAALPRYTGEYEKLFISTIFPIVFDNSRSISYTPTSTGNGYTKIDFSLPVPMVERYQNITSGEYYGDSDYYNYVSAEAFDMSRYPVDRFANEFGFHSMPSLQTWQQAVSDEDLEFNSSVILHRNHHYPPGGLSTNTTLSAKGMGEMTIAVEQYYPIPSKSDSIANFSAWCLATQRFQADMYKSEIEFYRRGSGRPERQLGSLYWQLEDIWQAPTWAGIEYGGRWKVLHYVAKNIYEHVIVAPYWNSSTGELNVTVTSDLWESASGTVNLTWYDLKGEPISKNAGMPSSVPFKVGPLNITDIVTTNIGNLSIPDVQDAVLVMSLSATGQLPNNETETRFSHENFFTPVFTNEAKLVDPGLELSMDNSTNKFTVKATKGVSLYTWLDYPAGIVGYFDENSFVLVPGQPKEIGFTALEGELSEKVMKQVTAQSIWDQAEKN